MTDLDQLIEAVEGGKWTGVNINWSIGEANGRMAWAAYNGSLDSANALHKSLIPGWHWRADDGQGQEGPFVSVFRYTNKQWTETESHEGQAESGDASRSWLVAILKAYRSLK